jgi:hypothetical protein
MSHLTNILSDATSSLDNLLRIAHSIQDCLGTNTRSCSAHGLVQTMPGVPCEPPSGTYGHLHQRAKNPHRNPSARDSGTCIFLSQVSIARDEAPRMAEAHVQL